MKLPDLINRKHSVAEASKLRVIWSLLGGIWGVLERSWAVPVLVLGGAGTCTPIILYIIPSILFGFPACWGSTIYSAAALADELEAHRIEDPL